MRNKILSVRKIKTNLKFYRTSAGKSTFRTQNDTNSNTFRYAANKKYRSYRVWNAFDTKYSLLWSYNNAQICLIQRNFF